MNLEPPPGETGRELSPAATIEALNDALLDITGAPRVRFSNVRDIDVTRVGRWTVIKVKSKGAPNELTFRVNRAWTQVLADRLAKVLEK